VKFAAFNRMPYRSPDLPRGGRWPLPGAHFEPELAKQSMRDAIEQFEAADALGFDWVTCGEHHYGQIMSPSGTILAGVATQHVKRAKIALLGSLIPMMNPVRVAEEYAMIDVLSEGRLVAGLLRGAPYEYVVYHTNPSESRGRFEEGFELILKAWSEPQPFGWQGRYYELSTVSIWPRPLQQPHPPVFVSGSSKESGDFAARNRLGLGLAFTTLPNASVASRYYRDQAAAAGWQPTPDEIVYQTNIYVAESDEQAREDALRYIFGHGPAHGASGGSSNGRSVSVGPTMMQVNGWVAGAGFYGERDAAIQRRFQHDIAREQQHQIDQQIELGQIFCGGPEAVINQIRRAHEQVGCGILNLIFQLGSLPQAKILRSMELFATRVAPALRELGSPACGG
jgi:alkanesulfonate monooxygenase SsuD/methylene tetrahydromethanopterin reductase-like flavin-dependent oxidoreductase (luciferase family)